MNRERDQRGSRGPVDQRDPRTQRDQRDEYRQHSPAWIRAQRRKRKQILRRRIMIGGAIICLILIIGVIRLISGLFGHGREDNGYGRGGIHIPGIRYQRQRDLKGMTKSEAKAAIGGEVSVECEDLLQRGERGRGQHDRHGAGCLFGRDFC